MRMKPSLEAADAAAIMTAAKVEAAKMGWKVSIAIVDDGGSLILLERLDGAPARSPDVATEKARTSAFYRRPSKQIQELVQQRPEMLRLPAALPIQGGLPLIAGSECVGGIGVSGVQSHEDEQIAAAGALVLDR